jgi:hypothetical protein
VPSELQRITQALLATLAQVPQVVAHLQRTAAWCRQQIGVVHQTFGTTHRDGQDLVLLLDHAARRCDEAAHLLALAPPRARAWAQALADTHPSGLQAPTERPQATEGPMTNCGVSSGLRTDSHSTASSGGASLETEGGRGGKADRCKTVVSRVCSALGISHSNQIETLRDSYHIAYRFLGPFIVKVADDILVDLRAAIAEDGGQRFAFVGRDGHSLAVSIRELDPAFYKMHCSEVVLSRALVESALQDLEENQGKSFPELAAFRGAASKVKPSDRVGAVSALADYLHENGLPVGLPSSRITLIDTSYKGTVQELLSAIYPATRFEGRYAFFAESPDDPHPGSKKGYALHLDASTSNDGIPVSNLPTDVSRTFSHQDALGSIEETLHGPRSSPKRIEAGVPQQEDLREDPDPLDGLVHSLVTPRLRSPIVREGVMHLSLSAIQHHAVDIASQRDAGEDYRARLASGAIQYREHIRAWITGDAVDAGLKEFMDAFVRRVDKKAASALAKALRRLPLAAERFAVWEKYRSLSSPAEKENFAEHYVAQQMQIVMDRRSDHG